MPSTTVRFVCLLVLSVLGFCTAFVDNPVLGTRYSVLGTRYLFSLALPETFSLHFDSMLNEITNQTHKQRRTDKDSYDPTKPSGFLDELLE